MKPKLILLICFIGLCISCKETEKKTPEPFVLDLNTLTPTILKQDGEEIHQYWELDDRAELWSTDFVVGKAIQEYRDSIKMALGQEKYDEVRARERHIGERDESTPRDSLDNWEIVHQGLAGTIRDINLLESQLLNYQASRYPLFSNPTEFHGFIMRNESTNKIRAFFTASEEEFPPQPRPVVAEVEKLHKQGWELVYHLHNHFRQPHEFYLGAMGPSMPDAQYLKYKRDDFGLEAALVTNGFTTCVIPAAELDVFNSH